MTSTEAGLDLVCLGRAAVDLYGEQLGVGLEDVGTFRKSLGGCAANVAVGAARQGLRVAMLSRVGDEAMGRYVRRTLADEGVDVSSVSTDPERLTGLVLLSIRDADTFPLIFYRTDCADMALRPEHVAAAPIAAAKAVLLTGTHLSTEGVRAASRAAIAAARAGGTRVVLDIDYRPVLWGLTGHDRGEDRYVASRGVTEVLQEMLPDCDLVVGTEEEIRVAGGTADVDAAVAAIRARTDAAIVIKRGPEGCSVRPSDGAPIDVPGVPVEILNVLGAGDAFLAGFLRGWLESGSWAEAGALGNACGALVVSRHACAPAIPTRAELDAWHEGPHGLRVDLDPEVARLHRVTTRPSPPDELCVLAFDHRIQLERLAESCGASQDRLPALKQAIAEGAARAARRTGLARPGAIVDDRYGREVLRRLSGPESPWWLARPIEKPADPALAFEGDPNVELELRTWSPQHVVKCLVHPVVEDEALSAWQDARLVRLDRACKQLDRQLMLELLPRAKPGGPVDPELLPSLLERIYDLDVTPDWWKLPAPADDDVWRQLDAVVTRRDPDCRGVLLLGLDAPAPELARNLERAGTHPLCRGFAVGRTIFFEPAARWLRGALDDEGLSEAVASAFVLMVEAFRRGRRT